jgi:hypothetical protein
MSLVQDEHVVQAFAADTPDEPLARADWLSHIRWIGRGRAIGVLGVLGPAGFERNDLDCLLVDDGEQLDDQLTHDERGMVPTGGIQRKPCWQWEKGRHCSPLVACNDRCNHRSPHVISDLRPRPALFPLGVARRSSPWRGTIRLR